MVTITNAAYEGEPEYQVRDLGGTVYQIVLTGPQEDRVIGSSSTREDALNIAVAMNRMDGL